MSALLKTKLARALRGLTSAAGPSVAAAVPSPGPDVHPRDAAFLLDDPAFARMLDRADAALATTPSADRPALFAKVPLDVFALLNLAAPTRFPNLSAWLPSMAPAHHQFNSVGSTGQTALIEAAAFVRAMVAAYEADGGAIGQARILDYGICWARLSRLLYKYAPVENLYGVDAWPSSLELARDAGYRGQLALVDAAPTSLPFAEPMDIVFAFSVFTHLSQAATDAAAGAIRKGLRPGGLFAFTVRPAGFHQLLGEQGPAHKAALDATGLSFTPEAWAIEANNPHYGNTTISLDYIQARWAGFELAGVELNAIDPYQLLVLLRAV